MSSIIITSYLLIEKRSRRHIMRTVDGSISTAIS